MSVLSIVVAVSFLVVPDATAGTKHSYYGGFGSPGDTHRWCFSLWLRSGEPYHAYITYPTGRNGETLDWTAGSVARSNGWWWVEDVEMVFKLRPGRLLVSGNFGDDWDKVPKISRKRWMQRCPGPPT